MHKRWGPYLCHCDKSIFSCDINVLWTVTAYKLVETYSRFEGIYCCCLLCITLEVAKKSCAFFPSIIINNTLKTLVIILFILFPFCSTKHSFISLHHIWSSSHRRQTPHLRKSCQQQCLWQCANTNMQRAHLTNHIVLWCSFNPSVMMELKRTISCIIKAFILSWKYIQYVHGGNTWSVYVLVRSKGDDVYEKSQYNIPKTHNSHSSTCYSVFLASFSKCKTF